MILGPVFVCYKNIRPHIPLYHLTEVKFHYKNMIFAQNEYNRLYTDELKQHVGVKDKVDIINPITILLDAY